jgi:chromosome partitioning protein
MKAGTRLGGEVAEAAKAVGGVAEARLASRVIYAETLGDGRAVPELRGPGAGEVAALADEVLAAIA